MIKILNYFLLNVKNYLLKQRLFLQSHAVSVYLFWQNNLFKVKLVYLTLLSIVLITQFFCVLCFADGLPAGYVGPPEPVRLSYGTLPEVCKLWHCHFKAKYRFK